MDEAAQEWDGGIVLRSGLIPGAARALRRIRGQGHRIALVADAEVKSMENVYRQHKLEDCFDAQIISETLGASKPDPAMFRAAMDALGLSEADKGRVIMVGNNLRRDIPGANRFGIVSVWIDWSPRYFREPREQDEIPDYTIHSPDELPPLMERLEEALGRGESIKKLFR
ncbi:MAG: HAD family hydrolase [Treponema sp.]|nr:HAD family hydrolase [Treponema sp.]